MLLARALACRRESVLAHPERDVAAASVRVFEQMVARRLAGEPIAHLVGSREFHGLDFAVTPDVLIPRPETELLVDAVLARSAADARVAVLDLGTGSGAIAIAVALHRRLARVEAVDTSEAALAVATANAARHGVTNMDIHRGDWYAGTRRATYDLIVSNPPYVRDADPHLDEADVRFEPRIALMSGADGLDAIRTIVAGARQRLAPGGHLLIEHGYDQGAACRALFNAAGFGSVETLRDLAGHERVCAGTNPR